MNKPLKIACVGEAMIEISTSGIPGPAQLNFAGDTLNAAIYMRRGLEGPHRVSYVTVLGNDPFSDQMIAFMEAEEILTDRISRHPTRLPGLYAISTDDAGERSFSYWRGNSAARTLFQDDGSTSFDQLAGVDVIYLSAITLAILPEDVRLSLLNWIGAFRATGGIFAFDSNYRPGLWESPQIARQCVEQAWHICDIALPSVDDEMALFGDPDAAAVVDRFRNYSQCVGALKRGRLGPLPINAQAGESRSYPQVDNVVDTTAAGDGFSGTFLAHYLVGASIGSALREAHQCASRIVGYKGAIIPKDA